MNSFWGRGWLLVRILGRLHWDWSRVFFFPLFCDRVLSISSWPWSHLTVKDGRELLIYLPHHRAQFLELLRTDLRALHILGNHPIHGALPQAPGLFLICFYWFSYTYFRPVTNCHINLHPGYFESAQDKANFKLKHSCIEATGCRCSLDAFVSSRPRTADVLHQLPALERQVGVVYLSLKLCGCGTLDQLHAPASQESTQCLFWSFGGWAPGLLDSQNYGLFPGPLKHQLSGEHVGLSQLMKSRGQFGEIGYFLPSCGP